MIPTKKFEFEFGIRRSYGGGWWVDFGFAVTVNNYGLLLMLGPIKLRINFGKLSHD